MKKVFMVLSTMLAVLLCACNGGQENKSAEEPATIPESSDQVMMVRFPVADYTLFHTVYSSSDSMRDAYGISKYHLAREMDDSNKVIVLEKFTDLQRAKDFSANPDLKTAMETAKVTGPPIFDFVNVIRNDDSKIDYNDRVMVKHRVKDFDAWLKAYDGEGMDSRKNDGLLDRGLARGVEDSNMVYIVFAIADMAKARARMQSPDLKKIMQDAGVEGEPEILMYRLVE